MRLVATLAIGWCALEVPGASFDGRINLPNSFDKKRPPVPAHIQHKHRAVSACVPQAQRSDRQCLPTFENRDASTALRLDPIKARKVRDQSDRRKPLDIRLRSEGVPDATPVMVESGAWDVVWPGLPANKRFSVEAGHAVRIELETITGRCERVVGQCVLRSDVGSKTIDVTVR
jgi:hypothetical protein